jgi:hypothetical protein
MCYARAVVAGLQIKEELAEGQGNIAAGKSPPPTFRPINYICSHEKQMSA